MKDRLRINFVMCPSNKISGGPLAILEYANRFIDRGHDVSITTYPDSYWPGDNPYQWFRFKGKFFYKRMRNEVAMPSSTVSPESLRLLGLQDYKRLADALLGNFGLEGMREVILQSCQGTVGVGEVDPIVRDVLLWLHMMEAMPPCDLNISTLWSTAFPVYLSRKGKPVYFMQHYEEVFYPQPHELLQRLLARISYALPMYKVANSSWLQKVIKERFDQDIPFSNNGLNLADFSPTHKASESDGVIRVFTYSRPDAWKGFGDAVAAMAKVRDRYGERVQWNVFGYQYPELPEDNPYAKYCYHAKLSFKELGELYARSDIAFCPSWYESFPLPPLEAMASGTAVVTTRFGTEDYAINDDNALVVGARDVDGMYNAICRLVEDNELRARLIEAGLRTAKRFTWEAAVERRERILLDIVNGKTSYDIGRSADVGLFDHAGVPYEKAPADVCRRGSALFVDAGHVFLLHGGLRRHITSPELLPILTSHSVEYIDLDPLTRTRTPIGPPVSSPSDIPTELCKQKSRSWAAASPAYR